MALKELRWLCDAGAVRVVVRLAEEPGLLALSLSATLPLAMAEELGLPRELSGVPDLGAPWQVISALDDLAESLDRHENETETPAFRLMRQGESSLPSSSGSGSVIASGTLL